MGRKKKFVLVLREKGREPVGAFELDAYANALRNCWDFGSTELELENGSAMNRGGLLRQGDDQHGPRTRLITPAREEPGVATNLLSLARRNAASTPTGFAAAAPARRPPGPLQSGRQNDHSGNTIPSGVPGPGREC